jgi:hypothetical protein
MTSVRSGLLFTVLAAGTLAAQAPTPAGARGLPPGRGAANLAQLFLARTAELQLNDQQVTRLAAIARRTESREQTRRVAFDSLRARSMAPADSSTRAARRMELANTMRAAMERARDERHADLRDALAVLNTEQQARAWELRGAGRGARARPEGRGARRSESRAGGRSRGELRRGPRGAMRRSF